MIPFFDSLAHVTTDGKWFDTHHDGSVERLLAELRAVQPARACVVAIDGYNMPNDFVLETCADHSDFLVPVAGFTPNRLTSNTDALRAVRALSARGFRAIKIHPTLCDVDLDSRAFHWTMDACAETGLPVFLCTIMRRRDYVPAKPPADLIYETFVRHSQVKVLLVHGGLSEVMVYADLVRALPNAVLDLSLTLLKYRDSSLDQDFRYLFQTFDRRITIGSDFPEWRLVETRARVTELAASLSPEKLENVLWRNLAAFLGLAA